MPQPVVTFPKVRVIDIFDSDFFEVQPKYSVNVPGSPALEFDPVTDVSDLHRVVAPENDLSSKCLDSVLEVAGGEEDISSDQLVL